MAGTQVDVVLDPEGFTTTITAGDHEWLADEPVEVGGANLGPNPYELVLAGLGACTVITLQMYARRKKWPLDGAQVSLVHSRTHAEDCDTCETETGMVDRIVRTITLEGALDAEQREKLMDIADRCPVHRMLTSEISIVSELR
jgi:putative redox protein